MEYLREDIIGYRGRGIAWMEPVASPPYIEGMANAPLSCPKPVSLENVLDDLSARVVRRREKQVVQDDVVFIPHGEGLGDILESRDFL